MSGFVPCPSCGRHVRALVTSCPFCATRLGTMSARSRYAIGLAVGLTFAACGEGDKDDGMSATAAETSAGTASDTEGPGMTSTIPGDSSTSQPGDPDQGGEDYAGPGDTDWDPDPPPEPGTDTEVAATDTGGDSSTGGEASTGSTGGEGTGSSTGEPSDPDAGGEDYAGPESEG
jgi:hypothetical protein